MTPAELTLLTQPRLSHAARSLYTLFLRPKALQGTSLRLNYPELGRALAVEDPTCPGGFSFQVNARQLTGLLDELLAAGLIVRQGQCQDEHYHGLEISLPMLPGAPAEPLAQVAFAMHQAWRPDGGFQALSRLCGVIDCSYSEEELGEFIAYWLGRPEQFATQHQWMLKFIKALKARRYVRQSQHPPVGYQQGVAEPIDKGPSPRALEMIATAERLRFQGKEHD